MTFNHAQAWIEFAFNTDNTDDVVKIQKIEINDIYTGGNLNINNNGGNAKAAWDFRFQSAATQLVPDIFSSYDQYLKAEYKYWDLLIPEQTKTSFTITYTLGTSTTPLTYKYDLKKENWLMGSKYIYKIKITALEITIEPTVVEWATGSVTDLVPADLK